jgi:putative ABC transport system permease protein
VRFSALLYFYGRRLRTRGAQELLAGAGIMIGVALMFAVQVANDSISGSSAEIVKSIAGPATLQLRSRDSDGFDQALLVKVQRLPGVLRAASLLDLPATIVGPHSRRVTIQLVSADPALALLDGLSAELPLNSNTLAPGILLPAATAQALGLSGTVGHAIEAARPTVRLDLRGRASPVRVNAILGSQTIGPLAGAAGAIAQLPLIQQLAGLPGRVTSILVQSAPGHQALVRGELERVAAGRLSVASADQDVALISQALRPNAQATGFFALVSGLVGLLLAFNAMLLTTPERRRMIADLRIQGMRRWQLAQMLLFQALCLGVVASLSGLLVGDLLSRYAFHETPNYLAAAFPLGSQTVIGLRPLLISFAGGVLATCLAATPPLLDLRRRRDVDAVYFEGGEPGQALDGKTRLWLLLAGVGLIAATSGLTIFTPSAGIVAVIGLAFGTLLIIPFGFTLLLRLAEILAGRSTRLNMLLVATRALRATTVRSLALAATGTIAVFGSVAAEGAHNDLLGGLYRDYSQYVNTADLWVTNTSDDLATMDFAATTIPARIASLPGVAEVRSYQGGYLDLDGRRVWVIARSPRAVNMVPPSQILRGDSRQVRARLRAGGWITLSQQLASANHLRPGDMFTLPTPTGPAGFRIAATTTNLGWSAGAIVLNATDYRRAWASTNPSALEIDVRPGYGLHAIRDKILRVLGPGSALQVQTSSQRAATADALARQGLARLTQISLLLIIAAALAMAAAMGAAIWQRRPSLASLRIQSYQPHQLRGLLICESGLVLGVGCLFGACAGTYAHLLMDHYLKLTTGFPTATSIQGVQTIEVLLLVLAAALLALAAPGYVASRTPPSLALEAP